MESIADLFGRLRTSLPKGRVLDERAELIKFFVEQTGKKPMQTGVRLAHYSISELYALKSAYTDRLNRNGKETADKYYWWITKTHKV